MAAQYPTFQSFFQTKKRPSSASHSLVPTAKLSQTGDGFTAEEQKIVIPQSSWTPKIEYEEVELGSLCTGSKPITFQGRVANFFDWGTGAGDKRPRAANGCYKVIVKDDTGAITVRLWFSNASYPLRLGHLVSVWTNHVSLASAESALATVSAPLVTSIFPERDRQCHFMIHENSDTGQLCKRPLGYKNSGGSGVLKGLVTLKSWISGAHEVDGVKIIVAVESVGESKTYPSKSGLPISKTPIPVFDDTASATLQLKYSLSNSAASWTPLQTILILTKPKLHTWNGKVYVDIDKNTHVDIDPRIADAEWLRGYAKRLHRREDVNPPFPAEDFFDIDSAAKSDNLALFKLADADAFARSARLGVEMRFMGCLSVIVMECHLVSLFRQGRLFSTTHAQCGMPVYSNSPTARCKACAATVKMRLNPFIVGVIVDETGVLARGSVGWSDEAWRELLGRAEVDIARLGVEGLREVESRLLFCRITLMFGWKGEEGDGGIGRVWVWGVRA